MARYSGEQHLSVEEAVSQIDDGMRVLISPTCGEPRQLLEELTRQAERFDRLEIIGGMTCDGLPILAPGLEKHFHYTTWHVTSGSRRAVKEGRASYTPMRYSELARELSPGGALAVDVLLARVTSHQSDGFVSLGPSVSYCAPAAKYVPHVIAEENPNVPWTLGESLLEARMIDALAPTDGPLAEYPAPKLTREARTIARFVSELIPDGATIQIGVGSVPEAILDLLHDRRDLAMHSIITDHMIPLFESGVINGRKKKVNPGKCDVGEIMGSIKLMKFVDRNPLINMLPAAMTHDPRRIAKYDKFISVNSALQMDLTGQVNAEGFGNLTIASIGGQFDFVLGSQWSKGGKSIFALPSVGGRDGSKSRIVARFDPGTPVTTPRHMVQYVVTEYGVADLRGKSLKRRAELLINIAHPKFREGLVKTYFDTND